MVSQRYVRGGAFLAACWIGLGILWLNRFNIFTDSISYLEMAQNDLHRPWLENANGYWSPLLPALIALAYRIFHPSIQGEMFVADGVLYATYLFSLLAYFFFQRRLEHAFPEWTGEKSATLFLFGFSTVTATGSALLYESIEPDLLVVGFFLLACGSLAGFRHGKPTPLAIPLFALVLAFGYLSKAIFFPLSFVFILCFHFLRRKERAPVAYTLLLTLLFFAFSAVQWLPLSLDRHHFTFGDTGKLNYVLQVSLGGEPTDTMVRQTNLDGTPLPHPVRVVSTVPAIYEFNGPLPATYPLWYDLSYWLDGLHFAFRPGRQLEVLALNSGQLLGVLSGTPHGCGPSLALVALLALLFLAPQRRELLRGLPWEIFVPALAGLGAYFITLVLYRYVIGFVSVLLIGLFAHLLSRLDGPRLTAARAVALALFAGTFLVLAGQMLQNIRLDIRGHTWAALIDNRDADAARALHDLGVGEGAPAAEMGALEGVYFPELARIRFVSLVLDSDAFWKSSDSERQRVYQLLATTGAQEIIAKAPPRRFPIDGWVPIGESDYILYHLKPAAP